MAIDEDTFKNVRDEIERPLAEDLKSIAGFMGIRSSDAHTSGGDEAAMRETFAQAVALGALYHWLRETLCEGDAVREAALDEMVKDTRKRLVTGAAVRAAITVVPRG